MDSAALRVKPSGDCWSVLVGGDDAVSVAPKESNVLEITVRNAGENPADFEVSASGPEWAYLEPTKVHLGYDEEKAVYLYVSPPLGTEAGTYKVSITVASEMAERGKEIEVTVSGEGQPAGPADQAGGGDDNASISIGGGTSDVTLNASFTDQPAQPSGDSDGGITGQIVGIVPAWKTIIVGAITIIIVMILVVRFAFLVRD
jgi:hypothetical protein